MNMGCFRAAIFCVMFCAALPAQTAPSFEVASIKLNHSGDGRVMIQMPAGGRFVAHNMSAKMLIAMAYKIKDHQISGGPAWIDSERYDISAKAESKASSDEVLLMLRAMLAERFQLTLRTETKEMPVYVLTVAKSGPKLEEFVDSGVPEAPFEPGRGPALGRERAGMLQMGRGELSARGLPVSNFSTQLARMLGREVIDKTGLTGKYNFTLKWTPDESQSAMFRGPGDAAHDGGPPPPDANGPSIFSALEDQLGLKLVSQKGPVDIYVINAIEKPSEN